MAQWLRGAGGEEPDRGVEFQSPPVAVTTGCGRVEPLGDESAVGRVPAWAHRCQGEGCRHAAGAAAS
eukprot:718755-Prymnesium_polylepis.1